MAFELKKLPYPKSALEPVISERTVSYHYDKHHAGYVAKTNQAIAGTELAGATLEQVIQKAPDEATYNVAAQVWNHDLYWQSLTPEPCKVGAELAGLIKDGFGSQSAFEEQFKHAALNQFGSGWVWLALDQQSDKLVIHSTTDAVCPLGSELKPLLTLDVWEHAYYLDYQNDRAGYVEKVLERLINWETAASRLTRLKRAA
ncbi:MAG: superoxide dismutase [Pseudomonadales bacterium]